MNASADRSKGNGLEPELASVTEDIAGKRLLYKIYPGIKFHDGSELTADVAMWGYQRTIDAGRFWGMNYFDGMEKIDTYTFAIKFKSYTNALIQNWAWSHARSKAAFDAGTGGSKDSKVIQEWDETHIVGTGPFKLVEYVRDSHMTWTKFTDYFRKAEGLPYLDRIEIRYIPDSVTAKALMQAGEADYWTGATVRDQIDLYNKGFKKVSGWPGLVYSIWPNTSSPTSEWNDINLRYALDYAIDKAAIAKALGGGEYPPLFQMAPPGEWGYDPAYPVRKYNVAKAKELLSAAGFKDGMKVKLLINSSSAGDRDGGAAIKQYLDAVGIQTELDLADPGRFFGSVWGALGAQPGLSLMWSGMDVTNLLTYQRWFSTDPFTDLVYLGHTEDQKALDDAAKAAPEPASQKAAAEKVYKYLNDTARLIPMYQVPSAAVAAPWVHSQQFQQGFVRWQQELIWMEKH
jgi:peptide/nickel transport system substrate-binding protein